MFWDREKAFDTILGVSGRKKRGTPVVARRLPRQEEATDKAQRRLLEVEWVDQWRPAGLSWHCFCFYVRVLSGLDSYLNIFADDAEFMREVWSVPECDGLQRDLDKEAAVVRDMADQVQPKQTQCDGYGIQSDETKSRFIIW